MGRPESAAFAASLPVCSSVRPSVTNGPARRATPGAILPAGEPHGSIPEARESRHPEQAVFAMGDLSASAGYASVPGVAKLLDRHDELEAQTEALRKLYVWYREWSETAR
jgi:hypothetical protein